MPKLIVPPNIIGSSGPETIEARTSAFNDIAIQVNAGGTIDTRGGRDTIYAYADGDTSYGISDGGSIMLGSGNDSLDGNGSFAGLSVHGILDAGWGSDTIRGGGNSSGFSHNALGVEVDPDGRLTTGAGNDAVLGQAYGEVPGNVSEGLMVRGLLSTGNGDDGITGFGINEQGIGYGIRTVAGASIRAGAGDDNVFGYGTEIGIAGRVRGGEGNDHFVARRTDAFDQELADQGGAVDGARIAGDEGDDLFDVGYGNARLDGGEGNDTLMLSGVPEDYTIQGNGPDLTILRDGYTMVALNFEVVEYYSDGSSESGADFLAEAMLR